MLLGEYLQMDPGAVEFGYAANGKPFLAGTLSAERLYFNVSHAEERAMFAIASGRELGVDIEFVRAMPDALAIAESFFSVAEIAVLRSLPEEVRAEAFFACWTRKEAYIKALGDGLSLPLQDFDVSLAPSEPARLLATRREHSPPLTLKDVRVAPGYVAALAAEGTDWQMVCYEW